jgi:hypothetical protein
MQTFVNRNRVILLHLSFWCVYLSFFVYQVSRYQQRGDEFDWGRLFTVAAINLIFITAISYLNYFYLLPRFLARKNFGRYLLEFVGPFALLIITRLQVERYILDGFRRQEKYLYEPRFVVQVSAVTLFIVIFVGMIRFALEWFEFESKKKAVENEKLTAELNFLKAQINPHFLFNTLNNLYYLAYTQSPNTTEVISKLSQMMRYMIYDSNHPKVPLGKEIEYMQNYISLERLRLNNQVPITLELVGNPDGVQITPLIFITFLENAFKHGVSNSHPDSWVEISIDIRQEGCFYRVCNSKVARTDKTAGEKSGIGLQNVQRRLDLSYPGQYRLEVEEDARQYCVQLDLTLSDHELPHRRRRTVSA